MFSLAQDLGVSEFRFIKLTFSGPLKDMPDLFEQSLVPAPLELYLVG